MEGLFVFIIIFIAYAIFNSSRQKAHNEKIAAISPFSISISTKIEPEINNLKCFVINFKGWVNHPYGQQFRERNAKIFINIYDNTEVKEEFGTGFSFLSDINGFKDKNSRLFQVELPFKTSSSSYFPDWSPIRPIPIVALIHPTKGERKLMFRVIIADSNFEINRGVVTEAHKSLVFHLAVNTINYNFEELGYLDGIINRPKIEDLTIQLAVAFACVDGNLKKEELNIIKQWISNISYDQDVTKEKEKKEKLGEILKTSYQRAKINKLSLSGILEEIKDILSKPDSYSVIDLLLNIAKSDDKLSKEENTTLDKIVKKLEFDEEAYKLLKDKTIVNIGELETTEAEGENLFGITSDMDNKQKLTLLSKAYTKWNAQTNSNDKNKKKRAREMVDLIVSLRKKYTN